jgi:hypothetical protein
VVALLGVVVAQLGDVVAHLGIWWLSWGCGGSVKECVAQLVKVSPDCNAVVRSRLPPQSRRQEQ